MSEEKTLAQEKISIGTLAISFVFIGIATVAPLFHVQQITGPLVNATLFLAAAMLSRSTAISIGLIPSVIALSVGTLPAPLAPTVPFIMLSNTILILVFTALRRRGFFISMVAASLVKFIFLFSASSLVANLILKKEIVPTAITMLGWPQLVTALLGGALAYGLLRVTKINKNPLENK